MPDATSLHPFFLSDHMYLVRTVWSMLYPQIRNPKHFLVGPGCLVM